MKELLRTKARATQPPGSSGQTMMPKKTTLHQKVSWRDLQLFEKIQKRWEDYDKLGIHRASDLEDFVHTQHAHLKTYNEHIASLQRVEQTKRDELNKHRKSYYRPARGSRYSAPAGLVRLLAPPSKKGKKLPTSVQQQARAHDHDWRWLYSHYGGQQPANSAGVNEMLDSAKEDISEMVPGFDVDKHAMYYGHLHMLQDHTPNGIRENQDRDNLQRLEKRLGNVNMFNTRANNKKNRQTFKSALKRYVIAKQLTTAAGMGKDKGDLKPIPNSGNKGLISALVRGRKRRGGPVHRAPLRRSSRRPPQHSRKLMEDAAVDLTYNPQGLPVRFPKIPMGDTHRLWFKTNTKGNVDRKWEPVNQECLC